MSGPRRCRGFVLMLAIFMIVTLAAIGVYLVTISTGQTQAVSQDELATRAYQAARSGIEWGTYQRLIPPGTTCPSPSAVPLPGLSGFCAVVSCAAVGSETEGAVTVNVYRITSTGCNVTPCSTSACSAATPGPGYVERQLQVTITQTP